MNRQLPQPVKIVTDRLRLVTFTAAYITDRYIGWLNDLEVMKYSERRHKTYTLELGRHYWQSFEGTTNYLLAIETYWPIVDHIGTMTIYFDAPNDVADIGILIGERLAWGQGYGLEAWRGLCCWLLQDVGVRKITAGTVAANAAMLAIMRESGMVSDGVRKAQCLIDGRPVDVMHGALYKNDQ